MKTNALQNATGADERLRKTGPKIFARRNFSLLPALLAAILPKCPLCLASYIGVFGAFGVSPLLYGFWIMPVALLASSATLVLLYLQARKNRQYLPLLPGLPAPLVIFAGKFYFDSDRLIYAGLVLLLISSLWLAISSKKRARCAVCV